MYGNKHRVVGSLYKRFAHGEKSATHLAVFLEYVQGGLYSFTYAGDINNDGSGFLDYLLGQLFRVIAFIIGVDWAETIQVGSLLGKKIVVNEFVAYLDLSEMKTIGVLSNQSILISTYALCDFANFSSIAIQIGGIGTLVPSQQENLSRLGMKALLAATLATLLTATIAGMIFHV